MNALCATVVFREIFLNLTKVFDNAIAYKFFDFLICNSIECGECI